MTTTYMWTVSHNSTGTPIEDDRRSIIYKVTVAVLMTVATFSIMSNNGMDVEPKKMVRHFRRPAGVLIGVTCQFALLPCITLAIGKAMELPPDVLIAALINSCCPGGVMSNFFSSITDADITLSVTMSTISTCCAFFMMPASLWAFSSVFIDNQIVIPYFIIALSLASLLIPAIGGYFLKRFKPEIAKKVRRASFVWITICLMGAGIIFAIMYPNIYFVGPRIIISGFLIALSGFFFGYSISRILGLKLEQCRAICFETGFQNVSISFTVITLSFPLERAHEMFALPLWYTTGVAAESVLIVLIYHAYTRLQTYRKPRLSALRQPKSRQTIAFIEPLSQETDVDALPPFNLPAFPSQTRRQHDNNAPKPKPQSQTL